MVGDSIWGAIVIQRSLAQRVDVSIMSFDTKARLHWMGGYSQQHTNVRGTKKEPPLTADRAFQHVNLMRGISVSKRGMDGKDPSPPEDWDKSDLGFYWNSVYACRAAEVGRRWIGCGRGEKGWCWR